MIKFGISEQSVIPVRREPSERAEMITQILFGETFQILEETVKWSSVKLTNDNYIGWIDHKTITHITEEYFNQLKSETQFILPNLLIHVLTHHSEQMILPAGSALPGFNKEHKTFVINENTYHIQDHIANSNEIEALTKQFLNCPYIWGGKNPFGIDCSGFAQVIYYILGKRLPRDAHQQVNKGTAVNFISDVQPGDLAFFDDSERNINHVGIILNQKEIIHASGKVRIDHIDQQGIFSQDIKKYTHRLRVIKRIL